MSGIKSEEQRKKSVVYDGRSKLINEIEISYMFLAYLRL
jgi:hypothetical protein